MSADHTIYPSLKMKEINDLVYWLLFAVKEVLCIIEYEIQTANHLNESVDMPTTPLGAVFESK